MFYKTSKVWILDFIYDGEPRRWFKALPVPARHCPQERHLPDGAPLARNTCIP